MRFKYDNKDFGFRFIYQPAAWLVEEVKREYGEEIFQEMANDPNFDLFYGDDPQDVICQIEKLIVDDDGKIVGNEVLSAEIAQISREDKYDKLFGRELAFTRAVDMIADRGLRTALWNEFRSKCYVRRADGSRVILGPNK